MKRILSIFAGTLLCIFANAQTQTPISLPAHASVHTGNVRGYYFTAPTCFTITGVQIPTDASTGNQSIAIMRLQTTPPLYATTTNAFDTLFVTQNNPNTGILPVNIIVNQGDIIGVLAQRGTSGSYGAGGFISAINGFPITLNRLGMQFPLTTTLPQDLWTETGGSISRATLFYDTTMLYNIGYSNIGADYTFSDGTDTLYTSLFSVWDYGDGSPLDTNYTPTHTYSANGTYNVCSYINTACGIDTVCTSVNVCIFPANSGFTSNVTGLDLTLTDASSNAAGWAWDFGDGNTSTSQNPTHTYTDNGWYNITQIVSNSCGPNDTIIDSVLICIPATANFAIGTTGFDVNFTDSSTFTTGWNWDFGDGNTSTSQNPSHTYAAMGWYTVTLISSNFCGPNDTIIDSVLICTPPVSGIFTGSNLNSPTASFTDGSSDATSWDWDFGDGNTSTLQNPTNNYAVNGTYLVCEVVSNLCGSDSTCLMITVCPSNPVSGFTNTNSVFNANFTNSSTSAVSSFWNFGDGNTSTSTNPSHTYTTAGTYFVCLTSFDECGDSATFCDSVSIAGNVGIEEISAHHYLNTYPNPASGISNVFIQLPENIVGKLYITDLTGKIVTIIHAGLFESGESTFSFNTYNWNGGIYLLVWETEQWKISKKLIVN